MASASSGDLLTQRALNRALLARQHLIERVDWPAERMIAHLIGLQAQAPNPPYIGLWSRLRGFTTAELSGLIERREAVRISLLRTTIHLVTAADCLALRPLLASAHERNYLGVFGKTLAEVDPAEVAAVGRSLVDERPRTFKELEIELGARWPGCDGRALAQAVRAFVPLVQVPPRGLWGQSGQAAHTSAEAWLGRPLESNPDLDSLVRRYLAAFGPATVQDMQAWSLLRGLRAPVERLRAELITFRDGCGRELFDLPAAPRPDQETPVRPALVAEFDNLLIAHADRTRIMADEHKPRVFTINGIIKGTALLDGFVAGTWKIARQRRQAALEIELFAPARQSERAALEEEGYRLLAFSAPDVHDRVVQVR